MADTTIVATEDTFLDESSQAADRSDIDHLNYQPAGGTERNPIFQFDVSALSGQTWDTVKLNLTFDGSENWETQSSTTQLAYILKLPVVMNEANWNDYSSGLTWATPGAETSADNHSDSRVTWTIPDMNYVEGDMIQSPDLTAIVEKAINENSGILFLLMFGSGAAGGAPISFHSTDASGSTTKHPNLLFSGVGTPVDTSANPVLQSAAGITTVSDRPPVSEPDRNVTIALRWDGPEPATLLAIIKRINYGEDA